jgi:hypothetical protein
VACIRSADKGLSLPGPQSIPEEATVKKIIKAVALNIGVSITGQVLGYLAVRKLDRYLNEKEGTE